jgi:hypothetical protein
MQDIIEDFRKSELDMMTLRVTFMCDRSGVLPPYLGSTIRGIMGHCFRRLACTEAMTKCFACHKRKECLYVRCFSNTGQEGGAINPYVIGGLHNGKTEWHPGDECSFELTIFGNAVADIELYMEAIMGMGKIGWGAVKLPFHLLRVLDGETGRLIYLPGLGRVGALKAHRLTWVDRAAKMVVISFDTPLRVVSGGALCKVPSFEMLIQFIMRRLALIVQVHGQQKLVWDEADILNKARQVRLGEHYLRAVDFERFSINQKNNKVELPAIEGWALYECEGEFGELAAILEVGRCLHIGKGGTIGFGHYETFYDV